MDSVANVSIAVESVEKVLRDRLRLRMSIMGRLHDAAFMASVAGKPDDNMSSLLQAMIKAATIFVADREDRANLDKDDVIGALEKRLQESQRNRVSVNDSLLSVLGEALQYALEHWPREDLNRTSFRVDASVQCEIPSKDILDDEVVDHLIAATADEAKASTFPPQVESSLESIERENGQAILSEDGTEERILPAEETGLRNLTRDSVSDHPINNADEEKAFPFRATAEFSQEPIVRENEQTFPSEDKVVEGLLCAEETRLRGLNRDSVQYSNEHVPVKEESSVDAEMTDNCTEEKDYGMEDEEYAPSSEEVGEENERMVQPGAGAGSPCHKTAVEKWPGKDLKEVIDHPIDNVNEEKGVPFLSSIDISREPIERENEQAIPMPYSFIDLPIATAEEDKSFPFLPHADFPQEPFPSENHAEGGHWAGSIEETGLKNLTLASAQSPANGHDPVYEENCGDMEMTYYCTEENDYGVDNKVYAPSSEERERMVPPGAVADFPCRNNTVEKWPRENLKEVIDHPIRTTDEVKIIPFLPPTGFLEESGRRNLIPDRVHAAHENGAVAEKHGEGMDIVTDSTGSEHDVLTLDSDDDEHSSNGPKFTVEIGTPNEPFHTRRTLTSRDVATLDDESYINDEIVNLGLARVKAKYPSIMHVFETHFVSKIIRIFTKELQTEAKQGRRALSREEEMAENEATFNAHFEKLFIESDGMRRKDTWFFYDILLFPVNMKRHWFLVMVVNPLGAEINTVEPAAQKYPYIYIVDSLLGNPHYTTKLAAVHAQAVECIRRFLIVTAFFGHYTLLQSPLLPKTADHSLPIQTNSFDCGFYLLEYAEWIGATATEIMKNVPARLSMAPAEFDSMTARMRNARADMREYITGMREPRSENETTCNGSSKRATANAVRKSL